MTANQGSISNMRRYQTYDDYLSHWLFKALRETAMRKTNGRCVHCGAQATEVHHTQYPKPFGIAFDTPDNLQPVCHDCHCRIEGKAA